MSKTPPAQPPSGSERDIDRAAILARRAMFITTALAGLGCTAHEPPVVTTGISTPPLTAPEPCLSIAVDRGRFAPVAALAPPLTVSDKLTGAEMSDLKDLETRLRAAYASLVRAYEATPIACSPGTPDCEAAWTQVVEDLRDVRAAIRERLCGGGETVGELQRTAEHRRFITEVADKIEAELAAAAAADANAREKWAAWSRQISPPQPCLKCGIPPPQSFGFDSRTPLAISFPQDSAERPDDRMIKGLKDLLDNHAKQRVILRGHADPSEKEPDALALARAEAVQRMLVGMGVDPTRLAVKSYGAELPIGSLATDRGRALNRRVDVARE